MSPIKAVGFDLDGTFISTHVDYDALYNADRVVLDRLGLPFNGIFGDDPPSKRRRAPIRRWMEENGCGERFPEVDRAIDDRCTEVETENVDSAEPYPRSLECIADLKSKGLKVGLLTRGCHEYARILLTMFDVYDDMDAVMGRDHTCYDDSKPSPKAMVDFASLLGVRPEEILYLGDNVSDYRSAKDAGAVFVGVLSGAMDEKAWADVDPDVRTIPYAGDVVDIIDEYL